MSQSEDLLPDPGGADSHAGDADVRLRALLHGRLHATWEAGPDGTGAGDHASWRALTGQSPENWRAHGWLGAVHEEDRTLAAERWRDALGSLQVMDAAVRLRRSDGVWAWSRVRAGPVLDAAGTVQKWVGVAFDVAADMRLETALRDSEERYSHTVQSARDYAIFTIDPTGVIQSWSPGAESVFGWSPEDACGRNFAMTFTDEDRAAGAHEQEMASAARDGVAPDVRWHLRADGSRAFIEGSTRALRDHAGELRGFLKVGQDRTENLRTQQALEESEQRFRLFGEASSDVLWIREARTLQSVYVSPAFERIYGEDVAAVMGGDTLENWLNFIVPDDRDAALAALRRVADGATTRFQFRIRRRRDDEIRWLMNHDFPIADAQGQIRWVGGIDHDITEEMATADRLQVLLAELQHRTRNLIGVIRAIATRTAAAAPSLQAFSQSFTARLDALGRVNGLLSRREEGDRVSFDELIRAEFSAHGAMDERGAGEQVTLNGPLGIRLRSSTIQTFALALHELATNAVKYGALSTPDGHVEVRWRIAPSRNGEKRLRMEWRETGVTPDLESARKGYGRELIERALPYQLNAETDYEIGPEGVRCTITLPISSRRGGAEPWDGD